MAYEGIEIASIDRTPPCPAASVETRLQRALLRILSAAEGHPGHEPMNWSDVAAVARDALEPDFELPGTDGRFR